MRATRIDFKFRPFQVWKLAYSSIIFCRARRKTSKSRKKSITGKKQEKERVFVNLY